MDIKEVLDSKNNGKEFFCLVNGCKVKNKDGSLFYVEKVALIGSKPKWAKAPANSFWVNAEYGIL